MFWIVPALAGLFVVYLAARFSRFRRLAEPVVTLAVAAALIAAFVVWSTDESGTADAPAADNGATRTSIRAEDIALSNLVVTQGTPETTYHLAATIRNDSALGLDSFTLAVTMQDCPNDACTTIGQDEALILARLGPAQVQSIRTTLTFPVSPLSPPTAIRWVYRIEKIRNLR